MAKVFLIFFFIFFFTLPLFAQVDTAWVRRYNGPGNLEDCATAIAVDGSGYVYVTGYSYGSGTGNDYTTIKYHPNGDTAWVRRYNGPANGPDAALALAVDGSGNIYVTGASFGEWGIHYDYFTIKYYPDGDTAWVRRYNGPENHDDYACGIVIDDFNNAYATGKSAQSSFPFCNYDCATIKYYANGDTAWVRRYNGPGNSDDCANAIAVDDSGNVCLTGESYGSGTNNDYATIKYYPNGDTAWVRRYDGPGNGWDQATAIAVHGSGNIYVTGGSTGDYGTIKYYPNGDTAWVRRYNGTVNGDDGASAIAVDGSGNVYVTGYSVGSGINFDYATIKYKPNGDTAWVRRYNGSVNSDDWASAIAVDGSGNVYVTGMSIGSGINIVYVDYATIKYYPNGDTAWVRRYDGPEDSTDIATAIAIDDSGNVYVTGRSYSSRTDFDYATIKYHQHNELPNSFSLLFPPNKAFTPRGVRFDWETATDPDTFDQVRYDLFVSTSYRFPPDSTTIDSNLTVSEHIKTLDYGIYYWKVKAKDNYGAERWSNQIRHFMVTGMHYSLGDLNSDGFIDVGDVVFLINYLYTSGPAPDPLELGDVNCDEVVNSGDVIFLLNFLFKSGPAPSC